MNAMIRSLLASFIVVGTLAVLLSGSTSAQDAGTPPVITPEPTQAYVNGVGTVKMTPDTAFFSVGVTFTELTLAEAQEQATRTMTAVIDTLKEGGVAEEDIQTTSFGVNVLYEYDDDGNLQGIEGYQVFNTVSVTVRELDQLGTLLDQVVVQGANEVGGIGFFVNDPGPAASEARRLAVVDAKTKAEEIAAAAGMRLGRLVTITESRSPAPVAQEFPTAAEDEAAAGPPVPVQAGSTEISVYVEAVWELVEAS